MSKTWYYTDYERNRLGPVRAEDLAELHAAGQLAPDTLVWNEGWPQWKPWRDAIGEAIPGAGRPAVEAASFATARGDAPAHVGNPYAVAEARSPYAPPTASLAEANHFVGGGEVVYAGFWKRFAAYTIDSFVVGMAFYAVLIVFLMIGGIGMGSLSSLSSDAMGSGVIMLMGAAYLSYPLISGLYYVLMESSSQQATLGKMAVGIKVTDGEGRQLRRGNAFGRWLSHLLCYVTFYIGYIMAGFTDRKRGLHDMVANTLVVDRYAFTAHSDRQRHELGTVTVVILVIAGLIVVGYIGLIAMVGMFAGMAAANGA